MGAEVSKFVITSFLDIVLSSLRFGGEIGIGCTNFSKFDVRWTTIRATSTGSKAIGLIEGDELAQIKILLESLLLLCVLKNGILLLLREKATTANSEGRNTGIEQPGKVAEAFTHFVSVFVASGLHSVAKVFIRSDLVCLGSL